MSRDPEPEFNRNNLPPWLRDQPLPPRPGGMAPPDPPADDIPDWLRPAAPSSSASATPAPDSELPDWLRPSAPPAGTPPVPEPEDWFAGYDRPESSNETASSWTAPTQAAPLASGSEEIPDWLREIVAESSASPAATSPSPPPTKTPDPAPEAADIPDWLRSLEPAAASAPPPPSAPSAPSAPEPPVADEMPGWLHSLEPSAASAPPPLPPATPAPTPPAAPASEWLSDLSLPDIQPFSLDIDEGGVRPFEPPTPPATPPSVGQPELVSSELPPWLRSPAGASADDEADEMPSWLRGASEPPAITDQPLDAAESEARGSADAMPDWLRDAPGPPTPPPPAPTPVAPREPAEDIPNWLRSVDEETITQVQPSASTPPAPSEDLPPWLRELPAEASQAPPVAPAPSSGAAEELPPWLQELPAESMAAQPPTSEPAASGTGALPDWLRELPSDEPPAGRMPVEEPLTGAGSPLPPWLQDDAPQPASPEQPPWMSAKPAEMQGIAPPPGYSTEPANADTGVPAWLTPAEEISQPDPGLPSWLSGEPAPAARPSSGVTARIESPTSAMPTTRAGAPEAEPPPWLAEPEPQDQITSSSGDLLRGTDLPAWLRAETTEQPSQEDQSNTRALDWLSRLRQQDEESEAVAVAATPVVTARPEVVRRSAPAEALSLMLQLSAEPFPRPAPAPATVPSRWQRSTPAELAVALILLLAVLFAVLAPGITTQFAAGIPTPADDPAQVYRLIGGLDEQDIVMVAYEWDARRIGELDPLEQNITSHLSQHKVGIISLSTDPHGTLLSFNLRDRLREAGYLQGSVNDLFLGYLPGGEIALRGLSTNFADRVRRDFAGNDTSESAFVTGKLIGRPPLESMNQLAAIIVMADEAQDIQGWIEQVHSRAPQVPIVLVVPNEVGPLAEPYLTRDTMFMMVGQQDALTYASLRAATSPGADTELRTLVGARNLGLVLFVVLLLGGGLFNMSRKRPRR